MRGGRRVHGAGEQVLLHPSVLLRQPDLRQLPGDLCELASRRDAYCRVGGQAAADARRSGRRRRAGRATAAPTRGATRRRPARWRTSATTGPAWATPAQWAATRPAPARTARWTWRATCGNGSTTGMIAATTAAHRAAIRPGRHGQLSGAAGGRLELLGDDSSERRPATPGFPERMLPLSGFRCVAAPGMVSNGCQRITECRCSEACQLPAVRTARLAPRVRSSSAGAHPVVDCPNAPFMIHFCQ